MFLDYCFIGYSNLDNIGTLTPQNDYTYKLRIDGNVNISQDLYINSDPVISYDSNTDTRLL